MDNRKTRKEVVIREGGKRTIEEVDISHEEYYSTREQLKEARERDKKEEEADKELKKTTPILKIAIIILVTVLAVLLYFNRDNLSFDKVTFWLKTHIVGIGVGDGYPVEVIGNSVAVQNFTSVNGNSVMLSETALTIYSGTGKEIMSNSHDLNNPALKTAGEYFMLYGINQASYSILTTSVVQTNAKTKEKILACDIAVNGTHAVASESQDFASEFNIYDIGGNLKYSYKFAKGYIAAIALNSDASGGVVSVVNSTDGIMSSDIYVFNFNEVEPQEIYTSHDNVVLNLKYNSKTDICAIGDKKTTVISNGKMTDYSYNSKSLSSVCMQGDNAIISLTNGTGESTVVVFEKNNQTIEFQVDSYIDHISSFGQSIAVLSEDTVKCYNLLGEIIGICSASYDTKAIALSSESDVYMMGLSKIEYDSLNPA